MTQAGAKDSHSTRTVGRLRAAWDVLMGQRVTPQQIVGQWAEYQMIFNDLLDRWSAKQAREIKQQKERIKLLAEEASEVPAPQLLQPSDTKQELRRRVATLRGFSIIDGSHQIPEVINEPSAQSK